MKARGYSLLEVIFVVAALMKAAGIVVPSLLTTLDHYRTAGAWRYVAARIHRVRMEAIGRSTHVALQFVHGTAGYSYDFVTFLSCRPARNSLRRQTWERRDACDRRETAPQGRVQARSRTWPALCPCSGGAVSRAVDAVRRSRLFLSKILDVTESYSYGVYADGDGDGVRSQDISDGVDTRLSMVERLTDNFAGVNFDVLPALPPVDPGAQPPGTDPIKLGTSNLLSYSASGTSSSGSVYILRRRKAQYIVRVLGDTGRARVLRFDARSRQWKPL